MAVQTNVFGTSGDDTVVITIAKPAAGDMIDDAKFVEVFDKLNDERARRGQAPVSNPGFSGKVQAVDINTLRGGIGLGDVSGVIRATHINQTIDSIIASGQVCVCNCNYCTCNCNFCTCNCNFACTCNCNYSDVTTKENIVYM